MVLAQWRQNRAWRREQKRLQRRYAETARVGVYVVFDDIQDPPDELPPSAAIARPANKPLHVRRIRKVR